MIITEDPGSSANPTMVIVITQAELEELQNGGYLYTAKDGQPVYVKATR